MSEHKATVIWERDEQPFTDNAYSRGHLWKFDGGATVAASSAPSAVPVPMSVSDNVDPEEAFVAALASCHMLTFLAIAAKRGYVVDSYTDAATGYMDRNSEGRMAVTRAVLEPKVSFSGAKSPTVEQIEKMHERSHELCYIANSVRTEVVVRSSV